MANETITKIASEYDMVNIMRDIGANYFGSDLSEQRVGMFGFITESMAHMWGASIIDSSIRAKEYNVATAQRMETLLYEASMLDLEVQNAIPETVTAYLGVQTQNIIGESYLGGFGTKEDTTSGHPKYTLVIEKDTEITISNYQFMFEYDIQIQATWNETAKKYVYAVRYLTEGDIDNTSQKPYTYPKANTLTDLPNNYIQSYVTTKNGLSLLLFKVDLKQMSKDTQYHSVIKNDMISLTGVDFLYNDQLSHFNIYYRPNGRDEWIYIKPVSIYDQRSYEEDIVHYEIITDENKIRLSFDNFTPDYNSEFMIDIYTTLGSDPNGLSYSGTGEDIVVDLKSLDDRHSYAGLELACLPISSWNSGKDSPTLEEIRQRVIIKKATLNSLETEYDLYNYMRSYDDTNDYVFIKKRSDYERRYSAFTIPRYESKDIIPSTTMNLIIPNNSDFYKRTEGSSSTVMPGLIYPTDTDETQNTVLYKNSIVIKAGTPFVVNTVTKEILGIETDNAWTFIYGDSKNKGLKNIQECLTNVYNNKDFYKTNTMALLDTRCEDEVNGKHIKIFGDSEKISNLESANLKIFTSPYTIVYDTQNQIASFYMSSIDKSVDVTMTEDEIETPVNFAMDHFTIKRNTIKDDESYSITVSIMPNGNTSNATYENKNNIDEVANTIMVKGFIYGNPDTSGAETVDGYFDFIFDSYDSDNDIYTFKSEIKIDDSIDDQSSMTRMINLFILNNIQTSSVIGYKPIGLETTHYYSDDAKPNSMYLHMSLFNLKIGFGIYYLDRENGLNSTNYINAAKTTDGWVISNSNNSAIPYPSITSKESKNAVAVTVSSPTQYPEFVMRCISKSTEGVANDSDCPVVKYTLCNVYNNSNNLINLYTDMSDFVRSTVSTVSDYYIFEDVPVLQYSKAMDAKTATRLFTIISNVKNYLTDINNKIINNFSVDYKFFRTYGPCRYFKLSTVDGLPRTIASNCDCEDDNCKCKTTPATYPGEKSLGNLDIYIDFNILIRNNLSISDAEVVSMLKNHIKSYIEELNDKTDYTIYISNIITELETKFIDSIKSIELISINGQPDVYRILRYDLPEEFRDISYKVDSSKTNIREYVPEYINVPLENITINITRSKY